MKTTKNLAILVLALAGLAIFLQAVFAGGPLEPSAPPGPVMKSLDEVEPRITIHASDIPLTISQSGSYYLVEDVNFTDTINHAITVECNDVTIDLMGYTIKGPDSGIISGVYMYGRSNVEVRNGTIRDFGYPAIWVDDSNGTNHRVINIRALSNVYGILLTGDGHLVKDCTVAENTSVGIATIGVGNTVTGNTCYINGEAGISAGAGNTVTGNTCYDNGSDGIYAGDGSTATNNTCHNNGYFGISASDGCTVTGNTCYSNDVHGISAGPGCTVVGNTARNNTNYGIYVDEYCLVDQNTAYGNSIGNLYTGTGCVLGTNCAP